METLNDVSLRGKKVTLDAICTGTLFKGKKSAGIALLGNGQILPFETKGYGLFSGSQEKEQNNARLIADSEANRLPVELYGTICGNPDSYRLIVHNVKYSKQAEKAFFRAKKKHLLLLRAEQ